MIIKSDHTLASIYGNMIEREIIFYICKKCFGAIGILEDERFLADIRLIFSSYQSSSLDGTRRNLRTQKSTFSPVQIKLSPEEISGEELSVVEGDRDRNFAKDSKRLERRKYRRVTASVIRKLGFRDDVFLFLYIFS